MGKFLKKFIEDSQYQAFIESSDFLLPNVSYVVDSDVVNYNPIPEPPKVTLTYNATADNLLAFSSGGDKIKSLKVDGKNIEFDPLVSGLNEVEVLNSEVKINNEAENENEKFDFPDSYVITSLPSSIVVKPKDSNVKIGDVGNMLLLGIVPGTKNMSSVPFEELNGMFVIDEENNQLVCTEEFLSSYETLISYGYGYGFGFCTVNEETGEFTVVDSLMIYEGTTGGLKTPYYFDAEGEHVVEMELMSGDFDCMYMFYAVTTGIAAPLTSVIFNEKITSIGESAFGGCRGLTSVVIPNSVTSIGGNAFDSCEGLTSVVIPNSVISIGDNAFNSCYGLTGELVIPDSVTSIGDYAFRTCSGLTFVIIGSGCTSIGEYAFYGCDGLTGELVIPDSVTSIGGNAFHDCRGLESIIIGSGCTSIGGNAFRDCTDLTEIVCHAVTAPTITSSTFQSVKEGGVLKYPAGSDYSSWLSADSYYLGYYGWTEENV